MLKNDLLKDCGITIAEFRPLIQYNKEMDTLTVLEVDCSYVAVPQPNSEISLLCASQNREKIVGVEIANYSIFAKFETPK